jgi:putative membrane protein
LSDGLRDLSRQCSAAGGSLEFCRALDRSRDRAVAQAGAARLLARATGGVARAGTAVSAGAAALADGDRDVARGAQQLDGASGRLHSSAAKLSSGARSVASGARTVDSDTSTLAGGTAEASSGATSLASGSANLSTSASSANNGAQSLSSGLAKGAKDSPTYTSSQQTALADTVSQPVDLTHTTQYTAHGNGWLLAAMLAVILWLAALAGALGVDIAAASRHARAPVSSRRIAIVQALPAIGLAMAQAVAVLLALAVLRVGIAATVPFVLVTLLAALCFALLAYALRLAFGGVGVGVFVLFLLAQVAALGNVVPLETAPTALQRLNGLMPMTAFVNATSQLATGGAVGSRTSEILVIVAWGLAAFAATVFIVKRQRVTRPANALPLASAGTVA